MTVSDNFLIQLLKVISNKILLPVSEATSPMKIQRSPQTKSQDLPPASNGICQDDVSSSDKAQSIAEINSSRISDSSVNMEVSSSTIIADIDEPRKVICDFEQVDPSKQNVSERGKQLKIQKLLKHHKSENLKMSEKSNRGPSWVENNMAPNDSSTVSEGSCHLHSLVSQSQIPQRKRNRTQSHQTLLCFALMKTP